MTRALAEEFLNDYVAKDGGGCLEPHRVMPPNVGCIYETPQNDNAILYLVHPAIEFMKSFVEYEVLFKEQYEHHMRNTMIEPGRHLRRCGAVDIRQSHDNVLAMMIGGFYFESKYAQWLYNYLKKCGWNYNVVTPGEWILECQIQGGDIAIHDMCVGNTPAIWNTAWLAGGLATTKKWNLADLRITFLKDVKHKLPFSHRKLLDIGIAIHEMRRGPRVQACLKFDFPAVHPFVRFIRGSK